MHAFLLINLLLAGCFCFHTAFKGLQCRLVNHPPSLPCSFLCHTNSSGLQALYEAHITQQLQQHEARHGTRLGALLMEPLLQGAGGMLLVDPVFQAAAVKVSSAVAHMCCD
jgi:adenosylmethionine-8-amino-7-oxononanoate aminotransferase